MNHSRNRGGASEQGRPKFELLSLIQPIGLIVSFLEHRFRLILQP